MRAAVLESMGKVTVKEVPTPVIDDESALVRIRSVSICGSDIRIVRSGNPRVIPPAIFGHEAAGEVVAAGKGVKRVKVGDRVAIGADVPCGNCSWCRNGLGNNCSVNYAIGYQIPGTFAEYMLLPRIVLEHGPVTVIPVDMEFDTAALAEPLACAINGLELVSMSLGKTVCIIGLGPIGCMMIDLARMMGAARVIGVQRGRKRLEIAKYWEADDYLCLEDVDDLPAAIAELTHGHGPGIVMTTCGSPQAHEDAVQMVAHRGCVNFFGGLAKDARPITILSNTIHYKECFVTGSHGSVPRQHELAVELLAKGMVRVGPLVTDRFPLNDFNAALTKAESHSGMKVVVNP
ncbi:MAG: alcohol dehydrogenase catalytic domain-containing protein [bacterium]